MERINLQHVRSAAATKRRVPLLLLSLVAILLLVGGCGSKGHPPLITQIQPFAPDEQEIWENSMNAEYRIRIGDSFDVVFKYHSNLDRKDLIVLPDGRISMLGVDPTRVVGLTITQLDSLLTSRYAVEYLDPDLSVIMRSIGQAVVYVLGEVQLPGATELAPTHNNVLQAIAEAGGYTAHASTSEVLLVRVTPEGYEYRRLDLSHPEKREFMSLAMVDLQAYDVIYVPRTGAGDFAYFSSYVLGSALRITDLFWDVYAITNLDKVDRLLR